MPAEIDYTKSRMTVSYLIRDGKVLLVEKGRNLGAGKLVGPGGRQEEGESIDETARREVREEVRVEVTEMRKVAEIEYVFPHNAKHGGRVTAYIVEKWEGEPQTTEEAKSIGWYDFDKLPKERMWHDNTIFMPLVLAGKNVRGRFVIGPDDRVIDYSLEEVNGWNAPKNP